jgi:hypothetical protein
VGVLLLDPRVQHYASAAAMGHILGRGGRVQLVSLLRVRGALPKVQLWNQRDGLSGCHDVLVKFTDR